jgi:hypothetical protein
VNRAGVVEELHVGHDDVDTQVLGAGKHHPGVHDQTVPTVAVDHEVHPEFAQTSQGDEFEWVGGRHGRNHSLAVSRLGPEAGQRDEPSRRNRLGPKASVERGLKRAKRSRRRHRPFEGDAQVLLEGLAPPRERRAQTPP